MHAKYILHHFQPQEGKKNPKILNLDVYFSHIDSTAVLQDKQYVLKLCPVFKILEIEFRALNRLGSSSSTVHHPVLN